MPDISNCPDYIQLLKDVADAKARLEEREVKLSAILEAKQKALDSTRSDLDHRLQGMNDFQRRMDRLEGTFATRDQLRAIERLVYIGVGIAIAIEILLRFVKV